MPEVFLLLKVPHVERSVDWEGKIDRKKDLWSLRTSILNRERSNRIRYWVEENVLVNVDCSLSGYACPYCEKIYLTKSRVKRHILDVHETGEYPCPDCNKMFTSQRRLKDHSRSQYCKGKQQMQVPVNTSFLRSWIRVAERCWRFCWRKEAKAT